MSLWNLFPTHPGVQPQWADGEAVSLGTQFSVTSPAWAVALRYPHPVASDEIERRTAALYRVNDADGSGTLIAGPVLMPVPVAGEWCSADLPSPVPLVPGVSYRTVVLHPHGHYSAVGRYFVDGDGAFDRDYGPLHVPSALNVLNGRQGSYLYGGAIQFPTEAYNAASYFSDVTVTDTDPTPPAATETVFAADGTAYRTYILAGGILTEATPTL